MDRSRGSRKRSDHELKRLIERAVAESCELPRPGLAFQVDAVEVVGSPPEALTVWATLHFTSSGSPFCCGEPRCHLGAPERAGDLVRRAMGLSHDVALDFGDRIGVRYHEGVEFHYGAI